MQSGLRVGGIAVLVVLAVGCGRIGYEVHADAGACTGGACSADSGADADAAPTDSGADADAATTDSGADADAATTDSGADADAAPTDSGADADAEACVPTTCAALGDSCGTPPDGCGSTLACGSCTAPQTCGGGGTQYQCGCTPTTCAVLGDNCGSPPDGCGATLSCGSCTAPDTCGGGGTQYQCGCMPTTCAALGDNCGSPPDGCGGTLSCGSCTSPDTCGGGGTQYQCGSPTGTDRTWAVPDGGTYAASLTTALVTDNPAATIYYTNDGTTPNTSSPSAVGYVPGVTITSGTPVQFFAKSSTGTEPVQSETFTISASVQTKSDFIPSQIDLGSGTPLAIVAPGAAINGSIHLRDWGTCPGCIVQVISAIEGTPVACLVNHKPGLYPGMQQTVTLALTAPSTPGTYFVYGAAMQQYSCTNALGLYTTTYPRHRIGVIVVQ